jgi:hypothetical protein
MGIGLVKEEWQSGRALVGKRCDVKTLLSSGGREMVGILLSFLQMKLANMLLKYEAV